MPKRARDSLFVDANGNFTQFALHNNFIANLTALIGHEFFMQYFDPGYFQLRKFSKSDIEKRGKFWVVKDPNRTPDGIYFLGSRRGGNSDAGHFVAIRDGTYYNSYDLGQQASGSNGFCQSYSIVNFMGLTDTFYPAARDGPRNISENNMKIVSFWIDTFKKWKKLAKTNKVYRDRIVDIEDIYSQLHANVFDDNYDDLDGIISYLMEIENNGVDYLNRIITREEIAL